MDKIFIDIFCKIPKLTWLTARTVVTYMEENKEISALFHLIDDPDEEVFNLVSTRIIDYGKVMIPNLENRWEITVSEEV